MIDVVSDLLNRSFIRDDRKRTLHVLRHGLQFRDWVRDKNVEDPSLTDASDNLAALDDGHLRNIVLTHKVDRLLDRDSKRYGNQLFRPALFVLHDLARAHLDSRFEELILAHPIVVVDLA